MTCSKRPSVMDCWPFSSLKRVDGVRPVFLENSAKLIEPRVFFRKAANCASSLGSDAFGTWSL